MGRGQNSPNMLQWIEDHFTFKNLENPQTPLEACVAYVVWLLLLGFV